MDTNTILKRGIVAVATEIMALAAASAECVRRAIAVRTGRGRPRRLELVESLNLGNRRQLFLVVCDDHRFLVGAGSDSVGTVVAMPMSDSTAMNPSAGGRQAASAPDIRSAGSARTSPEKSRMAQAAARIRHVNGDLPGTHGLQLVTRCSGGLQTGGLPAVETGRGLWS